MIAMMILGTLPSVIFVLALLYAVIDAKNVERVTGEAWNHDREA